jgi:hypothetical protein
VVGEPVDGAEEPGDGLPYRGLTDGRLGVAERNTTSSVRWAMNLSGSKASMSAKTV